MNDFLNNTELLDCYAAHDDKPQVFHPDPAECSDSIGFRDAVFTWSESSNGALTPSKRKFNLRIDGELLFKQGCINLVIGPTGSGKTSLLMALLGQVHRSCRFFLCLSLICRRNAFHAIQSELVV